MDKGQMQSSAIGAFESEKCVMISWQKFTWTGSVLGMECIIVRTAL